MKVLTLFGQESLKLKGMGREKDVFVTGTELEISEHPSIPKALATQPKWIILFWPPAFI